MKSGHYVINYVLWVAMMGYLLVAGLLVLLAAGYCAAPLLSLTSRRRRDAQQLRRYLRQEIGSGRRSADDEVVAGLLAWCEVVAHSGRHVPLLPGR